MNKISSEINNKISNKISYVFFGSADLSVNVLDELKLANLIPSLIVTYPDKPVGRKLLLTENVVAKWARENGIPAIKESRLTPDAVERIKAKITEISGANNPEVFIVAAYGRIIPKTILDIPKHGTLNVHPSLLPKYRGPSPILSAMLADERDNGVSIMLLDEEMDHGPIVAQEKTEITSAKNEQKISTTGAWPILYPEFEAYMGHKGGALLARTLPDWVAGNITVVAQDHVQATYTKKVIKEDGLIPFETLQTIYTASSTGETAKLAYEVAIKFSAYAGWPGLYTFYSENKPGAKIRLKITASEYDPVAGTFKPTKVIPEGKPETDAARFFTKAN